MWHPKWVHGKSKAAKILFGNPRRYRSGDPWEHTTGYMFHGTRKLKSGRYVAVKPRRRRRRTNPQVTTIMRAAMKKAWRQIKAKRRG